MKKTTKIGIIGAGHVGSHVASSLMTQGLCDEIVLLDTDEGKARRHADDIADSVAYMPLPAKIYAGGYEALADADIVVLSACSTIFEQDRLLELNATVTVIAEIAPQLTASGFFGHRSLHLQPLRCHRAVFCPHHRAERGRYGHGSGLRPAAQMSGGDAGRFASQRLRL